MRKTMIDALFPKTRQAILSACLLHPEKWWYLSDLAKFLKVTPSSLQRELSSLVKVELLESRRDGNRVYYKANLSCPGISELQSLLIKTVGVKDVVWNAMRKNSDAIDIAFIYGSLARTEELALSDVDVMIIGHVKMMDLVPSLSKAENILDREVNVTPYSREEFIKRYKNKNEFIRNVMDSEKIYLKGSDSEIFKMVEAGLPTED